MQNRALPDLKILGLTGGIAAGKSTVSRYLRERNGYIFDCDKIAHDVMLKGNPAYYDVLRTISGEYLSCGGEIDRKKLGAIVFADDKKLRQLETIIHSEVDAFITKEVSIIRESNGKDLTVDFIVIDAPLLLESGLDKKCDEVWVVLARIDIRALRIMKRNNLTEDEAINRINMQANWDELDKSSYVIIENNKSKQALYARIDNCLRRFLFSE